MLRPNGDLDVKHLALKGTAIGLYLRGRHAGPGLLALAGIIKDKKVSDVL